MSTTSTSHESIIGSATSDNGSDEMDDSVQYSNKYGNDNINLSNRRQARILQSDEESNVDNGRDEKKQRVKCVISTFLYIISMFFFY